MKDWVKELIQIFTEEGNTQAAKMVTDGGPFTTDESGLSPLHRAIHQDNKKAFELLLQHGADVNRRSRDYKLTALYFAVRKAPYWMEKLVQAGADVNARMSDGDTVLHTAARGGYNDCIIFLIEHGAKVDVVDSIGRTPLHDATTFEHINTMELLIKHGVDPNVRDRDGKTAADLLNEYRKERESSSNTRLRWG